MNERLLGPDEHNLILATWIKDYRTSPYAGCLPNHMSTAILRSCINDLIAAGASLRGVFTESNVCLGWVCEDLVDDTKLIHWIYVRTGLSTEQSAFVRSCLVPTDGGIYTYRTKRISEYLGHDWRHRPGLARSRSNRTQDETSEKPNPFRN